MADPKGDVNPFGNGRGTYVDPDHIEATFHQSEQMDGWKMVSAEIDMSGYLILVKWAREEIDDARSP